MATRTSYILLGSLLSLLYSCTKANNGSIPAVTCPSFSDPVFAEWFPYIKDQVSVYKNSSTGANDTISIATASTSGNYTEHAVNFTADSCTATATVVSKETVDTGGILKLFVYGYHSATGQDSVTFYFYGFAFTSGKIADTGLNVKNLSAKINSATYVNYNFQGKTYSKVQVITSNDTTGPSHDPPWIYKVFIAENAGVIGYENFPQRQVWALQ